MANELNYSFDVVQGFDFNQSKTPRIGFLKKLKVGADELPANLTCKDPLAPKTDLKCVAVLGGAGWTTGNTAPVFLQGQINEDNRQTLANQLLNGLPSIEVVYQFTCYEYDPKAKKYFKCFYSNDTDMNGLIMKNGEDLMLQVAGDPSTDVQSPRNYGLQIQIKPQSAAQQALMVAIADQKPVAKQWGVKEG